MVHFINIKHVLSLIFKHNTNQGVYAATVTSSFVNYSDNYNFLL